MIVLGMSMLGVCDGSVWRCGMCLEARCVLGGVAWVWHGCAWSVLGGVACVFLEMWHECDWRCGMHVLGGVVCMFLDAWLGCAWHHGVCPELTLNSVSM